MVVTRRPRQAFSSPPPLPVPPLIYVDCASGYLTFLTDVTDARRDAKGGPRALAPRHGRCVPCDDQRGESMAKPQRNTDRKAKPKGDASRLGRDLEQKQSESGEPPDDFVSDAEIEARERGHLKPRGHRKGK